MKTVQASVISFKRTEDSVWEQGIAIIDAGNDSLEAIVDINFHIVPTPIANYNVQAEKGSFVILLGR